MNASADTKVTSGGLSAAVRDALVCRYRDAIRELADALKEDSWMLRELALQGSEDAIEVYIRDARLVVIEMIAIEKQLKRVIDWKLPNLDEGAAA